MTEFGECTECNVEDYTKRLFYYQYIRKNNMWNMSEGKKPNKSVTDRLIMPLECIKSE